MSSVKFPKTGGGTCAVEVSGDPSTMVFPFIEPAGNTGVQWAEASVCNPTDDIGFDVTHSSLGSSNVEFPLADGSGYCEKTVAGDRSKMNRPGLYVFAGSLSWVDIVCIPNILPVANAGPDLTAVNGETVTVNGSGTDTDGAVVSQLWTQVSGTATTITNPTAMSMSVTPTEVGTYVYQLVVKDNKGESSSADTMTITITPNCCDDLNTFIVNATNGVLGSDGAGNLNTSEL